MGLRIEPPEYGNDCLACWAAGKTPAFVYLYFTGVLKGDREGAIQIDNGAYTKCLQSEAWPCRYEAGEAGSGFFLTLTRSGVTGWWSIQLFSDDHQYFQGNNPGCIEEHDWWSNWFWQPIGSWGYGGYAHVFWLEEASSIAESMGIPLVDGTFVEFFAIDVTRPVYKFCNQRYGINHTIEITP